MKQFLVLIALLIVSALFLSGCTETTICGDSICSVGEENTCPTDCAEPVEATVNINVSGGWDAEGGLSLYWHHSKDVYANASQNITSRLGEDWFGEESKNLYISFNDSESGAQPIGDKRNISMNFTQPGDYYFEVRSDDYAYRAVSEKITIIESKDYYVDLQITPSNPALRVKAYDEKGSILYGTGKITLTAIETYCEYGECNESEWVYDTRKIYDGDEMNALFFVYMPYKDYYNNKTRDIQYKIEVEKDGYITQTQYYYPYGKYSEHGVWMKKELSNETGDLSIKIVPGTGTIEDDILELDGETVTVCPYNGSQCYDSTINGNMVEFYDLPYDTYWFSSYIDYDYMSSHPPMSVESEEYVVGAASTQAYATALRGIGIKMMAVNASGSLVPADEVFAMEQCYSTDGGTTESCGVMDPPSPMPANPLESSMKVYSEEDLEYYTSSYWKAKLKYKDQEEWFTLNYKQGYNEVVFLFDDYNDVFFDIYVNQEITAAGKGDYQSSAIQLGLSEVLFSGDNGANNSMLAKLYLRDSNTIVKEAIFQEDDKLSSEFGDYLWYEYTISQIGYDYSQGEYFVRLETN